MKEVEKFLIDELQQDQDVLEEVLQKNEDQDSSGSDSCPSEHNLSKTELLKNLPLEQAQKRDKGKKSLPVSPKIVQQKCL